MEEKIVYFENFGKDNTETTMRLAIERAKARGINKMVLASTWGDTAILAIERLKGTGIKMVVVPHQYGFGPDGAGNRFKPETVAALEKAGHTVHFGTMLFHTDNFYGNNAPRALANLLRTFCQGMKVCLEIVMMAADAGKVAIGENVVVVAGTGRGADTAVVAIASTSSKLGDLHITEIICKPLQTKQGPPPPPPGAPGTPPGGPPMAPPPVR